MTTQNNLNRVMKNDELPFFKGRISKNEFTWSYLAFIFVNICLWKMALNTPDSLGIIIIVNCVTLFCTASLIVQRLHDLGRPGYYYWIQLIPIYNFIYIIFDLCGKNGETVKNKYGDVPKN